MNKKKTFGHHDVAMLQQFLFQYSYLINTYLYMCYYIFVYHYRINLSELHKKCVFLFLQMKIQYRYTFHQESIKSRCSVWRFFAVEGRRVGNNYFQINRARVTAGCAKLNRTTAQDGQRPDRLPCVMTSSKSTTKMCCEWPPKGCYFT